MEALLKDKILNSVAIMVINIEGKTNIQAKREIRKRLNHILNKSVADVMKNINIELNDAISKMLYEYGEAELQKILHQFDYQIDQLIPQELYMAKEDDTYHTEEV